jgi:hypothetical protein
MKTPVKIKKTTTSKPAIAKREPAVPVTVGKEPTSLAGVASRQIAPEIMVKKTTTSKPATARREATGPVTVSKESTPPADGASRQITPEIIASRAYTLWEQAGRPMGRDVEYWLQAEAQLKQDSQSFSA